MAGHEPVRHFYGFALRGQKIYAVFFYLSFQWCPLIAPIGEELVERPRLEQGSGEDVRPHLRTFFENGDADLHAPIACLLSQATTAGEAGRAGADNDDIEFHGFPIHQTSSGS